MTGSGYGVVCGRTDLHVHGVIWYWILAPDSGLAQHGRSATCSGPNCTFYKLLNCSSPALSAASCARVHGGCGRAFGSSWTMRSGLLCREPGSDAGCGSWITLAGRVFAGFSLALRKHRKENRFLQQLTSQFHVWTPSLWKIHHFLCSPLFYIREKL